jgi:hypothetical protein
MDPVAQRLAVHAADLRRPASVHPVPDRRQRQKPPALVDVLRTTDNPPKLLGRIVLSQSHRCRHGANPPRHLESAKPRFGNPPHESAGRAFGYKRPFPSANAAVSQADNALGRNRYSPTARETREIWPYISGTRISVDPNTEGCRTPDTRRKHRNSALIY